MKETSSLKKHIEESPKLRDLKRRRHKKRVRVLVFFGVAFVLLLACFVFASRSQKFLIQNITVTGNQVTDTKDIVVRIETHLVGNYAYVVPHRNIFLYPKNKILDDLAVTFPRLRDISIKKTSMTSLALSVSEVKGNALWCGANAETISTSVPCYFTDADGVIVAPAPYYSGNVYTRFFGARLFGSEENPLGKVFVTRDSFQKLMAFVEDVEKLGLSVKGVRITTGDEYDIVLDTGAGHTAPIRFLYTDNYAILAANLASAIGKQELRTSLQSGLSKLEYFDLRFTNKVYYKFSN